MPTGLSARKRVATETVLAGQVRVEYDDVARLLLQPAIERRRIVTGERHPETIAAQAQRQLLPEVRIILKQADTQQTIRARHIQSALFKYCRQMPQGCGKPSRVSRRRQSYDFTMETNDCSEKTAIFHFLTLVFA